MILMKQWIILATSLSFISHPINHQHLTILSSKHYTIPPPSIPTATIFAPATIISHVGFCERLLMVSQGPHSPSSNPDPTRQLLGEPFQKGHLLMALLYQNSESIPFLLESSVKALAKPPGPCMIASAYSRLTSQRSSCPFYIPITQGCVSSN